MTPEEEARIDWSLTTWKGSRRQQHREFLELTFREKLRTLEEMCDHARSTIAWRKMNGLPYFDPATGELVRIECSNRR